jgi:preprotein translocase subunit SecG
MSAREIPPEVMRAMQLRVVELLRERISDTCRSELEALVGGEEGFAPSDECDGEIRPLVTQVQQEVIADFRERAQRGGQEDASSAGEAGSSAAAPSSFGQSHAIILAVVATICVLVLGYLYTENQKKRAFVAQHAAEIRDEEEKERKRKERKERDARKKGINLSEDDLAPKEPRTRDPRTVTPTTNKKKARKVRSDA